MFPFPLRNAASLANFGISIPNSSIICPSRVKYVIASALEIFSLPYSIR